MNADKSVLGPAGIRVTTTNTNFTGPAAEHDLLLEGKGSG